MAISDDFTHFDENGSARMVNVSEKPETRRTAVAAGRVYVNEKTFGLIRTGGMKKGDVLTVAQIAGIMAAKRTSDLIPMCHPVAVSGIDLSLKLNGPDRGGDGGADRGICGSAYGIRYVQGCAAGYFDKRYPASEKNRRHKRRLHQGGLNMEYTAAVITVSDKGSVGQREDTSGPALVKLLTENGYTVVYTAMVPDEIGDIQRELLFCADEKRVCLVLTTGGTGFSRRDVTPEAMRAASMRITPMGCLSRETAGIRGDTLIINLPGSKKASVENFSAVVGPVRHGIDTLLGVSHDCAELHHHHHGEGHHRHG